jgi:hypothetical protein
MRPEIAQPSSLYSSSRQVALLANVLKDLEATHPTADNSRIRPYQLQITRSAATIVRESDKIQVSAFSGREVYASCIMIQRLQTTFLLLMHMNQRRGI